MLWYLKSFISIQYGNNNKKNIGRRIIGEKKARAIKQVANLSFLVSNTFFNENHKGSLLLRDFVFRVNKGLQ